MKYTGTLSVTDHQVGATVYIIENDVPAEVTVTRSRNMVDADENEVIHYQLSGYDSKWFPEAEVFASKSDIKDHFEALADAL